MIEIRYERDAYKVTVDGHAHSDEPGKDLVCAAVSILVHTLAEQVRANEEAGILSGMTAVTEEGHAVIGCVPLEPYAGIAGLQMSAVCVGFDLLAAKYPEFVHFVLM